MVAKFLSHTHHQYHLLSYILLLPKNHKEIKRTSLNSKLGIHGLGNLGFSQMCCLPSVVLPLSKLQPLCKGPANHSFHQVALGCTPCTASLLLQPLNTTGIAGLEPLLSQQEYIWRKQASSLIFQQLKESFLQHPSGSYSLSWTRPMTRTYQKEILSLELLSLYSA